MFGLYVMALCTADLGYYLYLPRTPDDKSGRTNRIVVSHGSIRFASQAEVDFRDRLLRNALIPVILFFAAYFLGLKWGLLRFGGRQQLLE